MPGWLLVGDPGRLSDPAQKTSAEHGAELLVGLGDTHRGILALDAELDGLDGARPRPIDLFLEWTKWLEGVPDAATAARRARARPPAALPRRASRG